MFVCYAVYMMHTTQTITEAAEFNKPNNTFWTLPKGKTISGVVYGSEDTIVAERDITPYAAIYGIEDLGDGEFVLWGNDHGENFKVHCNLDEDTEVIYVNFR